MTSIEEVALARNLLSSVLAIALPSGLPTNVAALKAFSIQQKTLCDAFERHNVFGIVTDGKALMKWQTRLLDLVNGLAPARRIGWELFSFTMRQSPFERLESLCPTLLEHAVKAFKRHQSNKSEDEDTVETTSAVCNVVQVLVQHINRMNPETRREALDLLSKLLPPLVTRIASKNQQSPAFLAPFELLQTVLIVSPTSVRHHIHKIETACITALFSKSTSNDMLLSITNCFALLSNASASPQLVWTQMAHNALKRAHEHLDVFAGKSPATLTMELETDTKLWPPDVQNSKLPLYQRAENTLVLMKRALVFLQELLRCSTSFESHHLISEREIQQVLLPILHFSRRAIGIQAHEVGRHTGVSEDGVRLPLSVVYAMLPRVHVQGLDLLSILMESAGLCALRHASKITRVLLVALESSKNDDDLTALAHTIAVCVRSLGASTVEKLGVPLLHALIGRCKHSLEQTTRKGGNVMPVAPTTSLKDVKHKNMKSKKRKRQAAAVATIAALNGSHLSASQAPFVSRRDEKVMAQTLNAGLLAIAACISVYGSLLPQHCRHEASELILRASTCRYVNWNLVNEGMDAVTVALLSDAVTANEFGAHGTNLLQGLHSWQRRRRSSVASSVMQLVALNVGEALLHPRGPPMVITIQQEGTKDLDTSSYKSTSKLEFKTRLNYEEALDWEEMPKVDQECKMERNQALNEVGAVTEEEDEDDDIPATFSNRIDKEEIRMNQDDTTDQKEDLTTTWNEKKVATVDSDEEDDFPDIVIDDNDSSL
ncbi:hypothetical protein CCR75_004238 [Bremia lactucae]|uniref:Pre-rRNA-processing protein RIX1 N-terminal domain-containing protein n=1 Tax=Bremia lactucae TaxID=4779 RepID=A0A976IGN2_BRELC|nr:hypothetical protein CCR75_004238 [Bremia lactucae]